MQLTAKLFQKLAMNERLAEIIGQRMGRDFGCVFFDIRPGHPALQSLR
jgi:hypothetical protein